MSGVTYDEKVEEILTYLKEGKTKEEISRIYNQPWKTLYIYMNRRGFRWENKLETFVEKQEKVKAVSVAFTENTKAAQIIRMLDAKHPDLKKIAIKQGFQTVEDLGQYMKSQGYVWDDTQSTYVENAQIEVANRIESNESVLEMDEQQFIHFLMQHQLQLQALLTGTTTSNVSTYKFKGTKVNKTLSMASTAAILVEDYSKEFNITQRTVVETALAEFFERHGYQERLKAVTI